MDSRRNHSFLYLLRPDGEEGELQRIAESNSVFPALWKILFAESHPASAEVRRVLRGTAQHAIQADARSALDRYERFQKLLLSAGPEPVDRLFDYLDAAGRHLRELIDDWSLSNAACPVFCADFDEMAPPESAPEQFLRARLVEFAQSWSLVERLEANPDPRVIESLLGFRSSNLRFTDWRAWSGLFGLALFEHDYFQKAFRKPLQCDYVDYDYDPLGVEDDLGSGIYRFRANGRWGVRANHGSEDRIVLAAEWDRILRADATESDVVWVRSGGRFGLAAARGPKAGALLLGPELDEVGHFEDGLAPVRRGSLMGFLRTDGSWFLEPAWERVWPFRHGRALVETQHHLSYIDQDGVAIVDQVFDEAEHFTEHNVARVRKGGRYGLLRNTGELALDLIYSRMDWSDAFRGWLCSRDRGSTLVHGDGSRWIEDEWLEIEVAAPRQSIRVRSGRHVGLLDWSGRTLVEAEYDSIEPIQTRSNLLLVARRESRVGVMDCLGAPVVPFEFSHIERLAEIDDSEDFLLVYSLPNRARPKAGIWDLRRGCLRAPCQYDRETLPEALLHLQVGGPGSGI